MTHQHNIFIRRCLEIAQQGIGYVAPNPMVGCVIVKDNQIIAEGYHQHYGGAHAEVNALAAITDESILKDCTLYVNLEPCSHHGKTPPCSDLIIKKGIKKVVIGNVDTNPLVGGKGIKRLQEAGIAVEYSILNEECRELNKRFFTYHEKKRPYIILKWAQTADGFISRLPIPENKADNWITGIEARQLVHHWRSQEQAIMVGTNTVMADNPQLTTRLATGENPIRIIIDRTLRIPKTFNVFNNEAPTIIFNGHINKQQNHVQYIKIDFTNNSIPQILEHLYHLNIISVIIEGGSILFQSFINANIWDEALMFTNPNRKFEQGIAAPDVAFQQTNPIKIGNDLLYTLYNK